MPEPYPPFIPPSGCSPQDLIAARMQFENRHGADPNMPVVDGMLIHAPGIFLRIDQSRIDARSGHVHITSYTSVCDDADAALEFQRTGIGRMYAAYPDASEIDLDAMELTQWSDQESTDAPPFDAPFGARIGGKTYRLVLVPKAVTPSDADVPLPVLPTDYTPSDVDVRDALATWDSAMPAYAGLLDAEVEE